MLVNKELYAFKFGSPVKVEKYSDFTNTKKLVKTVLSSLPHYEFLEDFSVSQVLDSIVLTGGLDS